MTNRSRRFIAWLLILVILVVVISMISSTFLGSLDNVSSGNIELMGRPDVLLGELASMVAAHKNGEIDVIDISSATSFSWGRLYLFEDYTAPSEIDSVVGRSWRKNCYTQIGVSDSYTLLVFTNDDTVVHCLDFPKDKADFLIPEQAYNEGLSVNEARFTANEYGELVWIGSK